MEESLEKRVEYSLNYNGKGSDFFGIIMVNWLLTVITLGFYYPWAKAKQLQYIYNSTSLNEDSFAFHGTGKEMFKGFLKAILIFSILYGVLIFCVLQQMPGTGVLIFYIGLVAILPIAIHGSYRYRMSRSSWRGIRFGYRGDRKEFTLLFFKWIFFTIITLGVYGPWMAMNMRNYLLGNVRFGDVEFQYDGDGGEYFALNIKGYLLTIVTLGVYSFWWQKELFEYYVNNLSLKRGDAKIYLNSKATAGGFFQLIVTNILLLVFTLGLGYAWIATRTIKFILENIEAEGNINLDALTQTEENYKDATGEDLSDFLNLDTIM
nr:YjgN family protein [uncultured Flavobacterium sp.]